MIELVIQLWIGFAVALSGVLIPGPLLAFIILKTPTCGPRTGTYAAAGHILVEFGILSLIALGFGLVLESELFQTTVGVIGGSLLFALGLIYFMRIKSARELRPELVGIKHHPLLGGVLFSTLFNPSVILWWATIGLATLMEAVLVAALAGAVFWLIGHFLADLGWFSLVSYSVAKGRKVIGTEAYKWLLIACGFVLLFFGAYFIVRYGLPLVV